MQRGDIVNVLDHHEAEPRLAIVTGLPAEGLVNLSVFPTHRNDPIGVLVDIVAVDTEQDARVEGAGEHSVFVAYPLAETTPAVQDDVLDDDEDEDLDDEDLADEAAPAPAPAASPKKAAAAAKKTTPAPAASPKKAAAAAKKTTGNASS